MTVVVIVTMTSGHSNNDQTDYIKQITYKVIVRVTGGHYNNDQTAYITQITFAVIVTMTGGHSNNDHKSECKSAIRPGPSKKDHESLLQ